VILRLTDRGMGDVEVTVDPIVVQADGTPAISTLTGGGSSAGSSSSSSSAPTNAIPWGWLILIGMAGLALGWWLAEEDRRGGPLG
jgi:hypothetical protein